MISVYDSLKDSMKESLTQSEFHCISGIIQKTCKSHQDIRSMTVSEFLELLLFAETETYIEFLLLLKKTENKILKP